MSALTAAGAALAGCRPSAETATPQPAEPTPTTAPPAAEEVTLEVNASQPEYIDAERQIWDVFEAENPGIKVDLFSINEDQMAAFQARIAGGYLPAIVCLWAVADEGITPENYQTFMNLGELEDFPWWDRWTYDIKNMFDEVYGLPGPSLLGVPCRLPLHLAIPLGSDGRCRPGPP